jgi:hypothetical protein
MATLALSSAPIVTIWAGRCVELLTSERVGWSASACTRRADATGRLRAMPRAAAGRMRKSCERAWIDMAKRGEAKKTEERPRRKIDSERVREAGVQGVNPECLDGG